MKPPIDIWNAPIVILNEQDGGPKVTSLAELWPEEKGNPMTFIPKATVTIGDREIGTAHGTRIIPEGLGDTMGYKEVRTPQSPECEHLWHSEWGRSGPIMVCAKCGDWHHD